MDEKKIKRVILRGPVLVSSGYGVHTRQIAKWLFDIAEKRDDIELYFEPLIWGVCPWIIDPTAYDGLIGKIMQHSKQVDHYDVSISVQLPNEWNPFLADYNIGVTAGVETDKCNPAWIECVNKMDLVIVPSQFAKSVLLETGEVTTPIKIIPEAYFEALTKEDLKPIELDLDTDFNFLMVSQITGNNPENDRKNVFYAIKWFAETFKDNPNVGLVVKTNMARSTTYDRLATITMLSKLVLEVKMGSMYPRFYLIHGDMREEELAGLYKHPSIKVLLSLTKGEGFGLPILEAAVAGLPVIVTNWSAHTEFLSLGKYIKVDHVVAPIHQSRVDGQIFMQNAKWAVPLEEDAKRKMRKFVENSSIPMEWAQDLSKKLKETYSMDAIKNQYTETLKDVI